MGRTPSHTTCTPGIEGSGCTEVRETDRPLVGILQCPDPGCQHEQSEGAKNAPGSLIQTQAGNGSKSIKKHARI